MIMGLPRRHLRPMVLAFLILASAAGMATSTEDSAVTNANTAVIYSTDFSSNPNWVTQDPYRNYWDQTLGMYHYSLRAAGTDFVFKKIPYHGESYRLEYDLLPMRTDFQSSFRLGLGNRDMYINQGTTILSEFENSPYGNITWLRVIDQSNQRREVSSYGQSYGGPSMRFSDGTSYHVIVDYSNERRTAGIAISFLGNKSPFWGYTLSSITNLGLMDRIYLSALGDTANPSAVAEGYVDNVIFRLVFPTPVPETPAATSSTTMVTGGETRTSPATPPVTSTAPVTTTKGTPIPAILAIAALALGALFVLATRR